MYKKLLFVLWGQAFRKSKITPSLNNDITDFEVENQTICSYRGKSVNTVTLLHNKNAFKLIEFPIKIIKW